MSPDGYFTDLSEKQLKPFKLLTTAVQSPGFAPRDELTGRTSDAILLLMTDAERTALDALGYTVAWLESGLLDRERLAEQWERFQAGGTRKTGAYRSQTLAAWLEAGEAISDAQLDAFLSLMSTDPDPKLAQSAIASLIQSPRISTEQLERIARSDPKLMRRHGPLIRRTYLTRRLAEGVTDELIERVIEHQDASVQTRLIRDSRLSRKHAERLAQSGVNMTIRENARAWLQDKKGWK